MQALITAGSLIPNVMRSSTIRLFRRATLAGAVIGTAFWMLKWILSLLHVLRDLSALPKTFTDVLVCKLYWDFIGWCLLCVTCCSLILLYVIVCPPPKDIDQHEA